MNDTFYKTKLFLIFFNIFIFFFSCIPLASGDPVVASNGYVTQIDISASGMITTNWQGFYGIIQNGYFIEFNITGNMSNITQLNITSPYNIQYLLFSNSTLYSLSGFNPGNITQLDAIMGVASDNSTNTFTNKSNFFLAGKTIYDVPTVYTNVDRNQQFSYFREGFLMKDSTFLFITEVKKNFGFNNFTQDYQIILPIAPPSLYNYNVYATMIEEKTSSGSGGSGGSCGPGIVSQEQINNIQLYEIREQYLQKNVTVTYIFTTPDISIYEIITTPMKSLGSICIRNERLKDLSKIKGLTIPEGIIYEYDNIYVGAWESSKPESISNTTIKFRIKKDWFTLNNIEESHIVLQRWNGKTWKLLETEKTNSDEKFIYYKAITEAFGSFAISSIYQLNFIPTIQTTLMVTPDKIYTKSKSLLNLLIPIILIGILFYKLKYNK